jgi:hypothetical protein
MTRETMLIGIHSEVGVDALSLLDRSCTLV